MSLALEYQDTFKTIVRLQSGRLKGRSAKQIKADILANFSKVDAKMAGAAGQARPSGTADPLEDAKFALAAFADETALRSIEFRGAWNNPPDDPGLIQLLFQQANAGNDFYRRLDALHVADATGHMLEVYALCLLLGYQGARTGQPLKDTIERTVERAGERLRRSPGVLSGQKNLEQTTVAPRSSQFPWVAILVGATIAAYVFFCVDLNLSAGRLSALVRAYLL
jgi:type IV/VI secretion system ImpK/VasF family protein